MGTKIEHSINLLATSVDNSNNFSISGVDVWEHYQKKGLSLISNRRNPRIGINKFKDPIPMDRNNIDSIKKTMQMHEDIFKHQVRELHRVYSVQKMLMNELKNETRPKNFLTPINGLAITHHHHHHHLTDHQRRQASSHGPDFQAHHGLRDDNNNNNNNNNNNIGSSRERSGSCSGSDTMKIPQRGFDLARQAEEEEEGEAGPSSYTTALFQGCKVSNDDEEMEVDLTLSIGGSSSSQGNNNNKNKNKNKKEKPPHLIYSSVSFKSDRGGGECSDPNTPMSSSSVSFDQERKGGAGTTTHWLSQGLKLK